MSCLSAFNSQVVTFLSVPHEVLFLQHRVFREYAKIAIGPDFIHTLPSFIVLMAMSIVLWKNPPTFKWLPILVGKTSLYRILQVTTSWITVNAILWLWLVFQRVLYCFIWSYWSYEIEYRDIHFYPWWQRVWSSYYPPPLQPPMLSASFISWIISMIVAVTSLECAFNATRVRIFLEDSLARLKEVFAVARCYLKWTSKRLREITVTTYDRGSAVNESEVSSICDDCRSEMSTDLVNMVPRREIRPISYGTDWTPRPDFSGFKETQKKFSTKSVRTSVTVAGAVEGQDRNDKYSPRQLRHRRGCYTVMPSNSSDKSSGC